VAAPTYGTRSAGTKIVFYPNLTPTTGDYAIGMEGGGLWFSVPVPSGNTFRFYEGTTPAVSIGNGYLNVGNMLSIGGDSPSSPGRPWIRGNGVNHLVINGPPGGYVYLGLDSGSYSWISGSTFYPGGTLSNAGITTGGITCTNINTQGYDVTTGTLTVTSAARIANIRIQGDAPTNHGYPFIRAAPGAHMCINANPLYLNNDIQGAVLIYGAASFYSSIAAQHITCLNVNTQGWNVTTGTFNCSSQAYVGALHSYGLVTCAGSCAIPNGSATTPGIYFTAYPQSGIYIAAQNPTCEFGANFHAGHRALFRSYLDRAQCQLYAGADWVIDVTPGLGRVNGHFHPITYNVHQCGVAGAAWYACHSLYYNVVSDVRMKDVHGTPGDVLAIIDAVGPFIGSFKAELRPEKLAPDVNWTKKFPTFSAQEIAEKIDSKYGTAIVTHDVPSDTWSMDYDKLVPLLWQAVKELSARVKALEN